MSSLEKKISELQQQIVNSKNKPIANSNEFPEEAEKILLFLAEIDNATPTQISHNISLSMVRTEYWLGEFSRKELVCIPIMIATEITYSFDHNGRKYLIENNLI